MSEKATKEKSNRGGAREGAGRPAGSKNKINKATIQTVIDKLYDRTGQCYEDLLLEDFLQARASNEALAHKYHMLLANKLMPDLNSIEVDASEDMITAKQAIFAAAIAQITTKSEDS
jgi:hypothetical protein